MQSFHPAKPLDSFPALRSAETARIENVLSSVYGARKFSLVGQRRLLNVHANHWQSEVMALSFCSYGARVEVEFPGADFFRQQITLRGGGEIYLERARREISRHSYCVVPPNAPLRIGFRPGFEQVVLRLDAKFLQSKFTALTGDRRTLEFETRAHAGGPAMNRLRRLLTFFIMELQRGELTELERMELEQSVAVTFMQSNPHADAAGATTAPGMQQLKLVEDYIEAHWQEPLSLEALCQVSAMSARSIFHHFRRSRGKSPMAFVKEVRLRHARDMLRSPGAQSVTEIAFACGFGNLGHFARDYRICWGERPSETRRLARGVV